MNDALENLRKQLELQDWPGVYLFKFILPNDNQKMAQVSSLFGETANIEYHTSRNGRYISVSATEFMLDVSSIMDVYYKSANINGVIAL
jgi:hypothetical protein